MKVVYKEPGKSAEIITAEEGLDVLQHLVSGWIECIPFIEGVCIVVNEEGKLKGMTPNFDYGWDVIVGPAVFIGDDGEDFSSVPDDKIEKVMEFLQYHAI